MSFNCPDCDSILSDEATHCGCGWEAPHQQAQQPDRDLQRELMEIIIEHKRLGRRWPADMPLKASDAASWFTTLIEPPAENERPSEVQKRSGDGTVWLFPYIERCKHCLRLFLGLSDAFQRLIVAAKRDGVWWRGDTDMEHFANIVHETMYMHRIGIEAYRPEAVQRMKSMAGVQRMPMPDEADYLED